MKKLVIAIIAAATISGFSAAAHAQRHLHPHRGQPAHIDTGKLTTAAEARIAATHAALRLDADQEKLWQPVASALRDFTEVRIGRVNARMDAARNNNNTPAVDRETLRRQRADNAAAASEARAKVADAAGPLYKTLNPGQKHLLSSLIRRETAWRHPVLGM